MARSHKDLKAAVVRRGADHVHILSKPRTREDRKHRLEILLRNLKDGARLFGEEHLQRIALWQLHPHAASARDRHFGKRHRPPSLRSWQASASFPFTIFCIALKNRFTLFASASAFSQPSWLYTCARQLPPRRYFPWPKST